MNMLAEIFGVKKLTDGEQEEMLQKSRDKLSLIETILVDISDLAEFRSALYTECAMPYAYRELHECIIGRIIQNGLLKQFHCKLSARWYENARWSFGRRGSTCHRRRKGYRENRVRVAFAPEA